ncbi:sporulation protein [Bacillus weihaiensis]|uniref:Sporulation protein SpoOM n=1 Tax=Bacillus weihaiensis TaxID=1547283 RepID=A0A1L3MQS7_9BACI|nr:sporulation protein [Bacillus weihaiensis]APH04720.1 sporulation protein SpoOM [Bacillus weihaiensis]
MSLFNKILASIGIGSVKVDTKLSDSMIRIGEDVEGIVEVIGGNVDQAIEEIYLTVNTNFEKEEDDRVIHKQAVIATVKLNEPFVMMPGETKTIPFKFQLPIDTPISAGSSKVWIQTGIDIRGSLDPSDRDIVTVLPHPYMEEIVEVLTELGFKQRKVKNEAASYKLRRRLPFIQEFEFIPVSGEYVGDFDEIEVVFFPVNNTKLEVVLEVDRRAKGIAGFLSEALDMDESILKLTISESDIPYLKQIFAKILDNHR